VTEPDSGVDEPLDASVDPPGTGGTSGLGGSSGSGGSGPDLDAGDAGDPDAGDSGDAGIYLGPSVGRASTFAVLAYDSVTSANISSVIGDIGVSSAAISTITDFDAPTPFTYEKYGSDSLPPDSDRAQLAQGDVTALVGNIDPRQCDTDLTSVGMTGNVTLHPGVTCMTSTVADVLLNGQITLDAGGDPNAFFIITGELALNAALNTQVILSGSAQACSVFWRFRTAVTMATSVEFIGTVIAGSAITMNTGATLLGRTLAQTEGVHLDANTINMPTGCTHVE